MRIKKSKNPKISLLIPAYKNSYGVERILKYIPKNLLENEDLDVIISDDSPEDSVLNNLSQKYKIKGINFLSGPKKGAAINWNFMLKHSNGRWIQFIHHDESPLNSNFFTDLISAPLILDKNYFHSCYLKRENYYRLHSSKQFSNFFLKYYPKFLLSRNFIGSPSCVLIARKNIVPFNERLVWNVDIDWYLKIHNKSSFLYSGQKMISHINKNSITNIIRKDITKIKKYENSITSKRDILHLFLDAILSLVWLGQKLVLYLIRYKKL